MKDVLRPSFSRNCKTDNFKRNTYFFQDLMFQYENYFHGSIFKSLREQRELNKEKQEDNYIKERLKNCLSRVAITLLDVGFQTFPQNSFEPE